MVSATATPAPAPNAKVMGALFIVQQWPLLRSALGFARSRETIYPGELVCRPMAPNWSQPVVGRPANNRHGSQ